MSLTARQKSKRQGGESYKVQYLLAMQQKRQKVQTQLLKIVFYLFFLQVVTPVFSKSAFVEYGLAYQPGSANLYMF